MKRSHAFSFIKTAQQRVSALSAAALFVVATTAASITPLLVTGKAIAAGTVNVCAAACTADDIQAAIDGATAGDTISFLGNASLNHQVNINKSLTIEGNGHVLSPTFTKTSNSNNTALGILGTSNVTVNGLTIDGIGGTTLHGINVYESTSVVLTNVTTKNNSRNGLVVNGSTVSVSNFMTSNNGWGGINVDQGSGVTMPAILNIDGPVTQTEPIADIVVDQPSNPNVMVNDSSGQYTFVTIGGVRVYTHVPSPPTATQSEFIGSPKYVRAGNFSSDITAQIRVPSSSVNVRFAVNGNTVTDTDYTNNTTDNDIYTVNGAAAGSQWYRLQKNLAGGQYNITAEFNDGVNWYPVTGSGTTYSIDAPTAEYVIPQAGKVFRANDKVVRVRAEDEFNQFKRMLVTINSVVYEVQRAECSDLGNYVLCDLQNLGLAEGPYTASTTTYTQANNRVDNLLSAQFVIDNTAPVVSGFSITNPAAVYSDSIAVSAVATDNNSVQSVTFFVTEPRVSDGACTGNGTVFSTQTVTSATSTFTAILDTSGLNGDYCVNVRAKDSAANNSAIQKIKVNIDNDAPAVPTQVSPLNGVVKKTADQVLIDWTAVSDTTSPVTYVYQTATSPSVNADGSFTSPAYTSGPLISSEIATPNTPEGTYYWHVRACDGVGNCSAWSGTWTIIIDNTKPTLDFTAPTDFSTPFAAGPLVSVQGADANGLSTLVIHVYTDAGVLLASPSCTATAAELAAGTLSCDLSSLSEGIYYIKAGETDTAGNNRTITSPDFTIDKTKPNANVVSPANGAVVGGAFTVTGTASDALSAVDHVLYTVTKVTAIGGSYVSNVTSGAATGTTDWEFALSGLTDGFYRLKVQVFDTAGNFRYDYNDVEVDVTAPVVTVNPTSGTNTTPTVSGTVDDPTATVTVLVDGTTYPTAVDTTPNGAGTYDWFAVLSTPLAVGSHDVVATATDATGNSSTDSTSDEVTVAAAPVTPPTTPGQGAGTGNEAAAQQDNNTAAPVILAQANPNNANQNPNAVLGANTDATDAATTGIADAGGDTEAQVKGESDKKTETNIAKADSNKFLGLGWWWLLILAVLAGLGWYVATRRSNSEA